MYKITQEKQRVFTIIVFNVSKLKHVAGTLLCCICYANHTLEKFLDTEEGCEGRKELCLQ